MEGCMHGSKVSKGAHDHPIHSNNILRMIHAALHMMKDFEKILCDIEVEEIKV